MDKHHDVLLLTSLLFLMLFLAGCAEPAVQPTPTVRPTVTLISLPTRPLPTATMEPITAMAPTGQPEITATTGERSNTTGAWAAFISETYPDNSVLDAGEIFTKAFELRNAGGTTWTTDYALVRDETKPAGETLGAAERLALPQAVGPGESITLELPLIAPEAPGTYTVYWTLQDATGAVVPVDGVQRVWVTIRVCEEGQDCSAPVVAAGGGSLSAGGVTFALGGVTHDGGDTFVNFCLSQVDPLFFFYAPDHYRTWLIVDGEKLRSGGGKATIPVNGTCCMTWDFPLSEAEFNQAAHVSFYTERVEGHNWSERTCNEMRPNLIAQYPGLDFECARYNYYNNLRLPPGMTKEEADRIIIDAIMDAKYGPWELIIK
jgi:hypothetical protein